MPDNSLKLSDLKLEFDQTCENCNRARRLIIALVVIIFLLSGWCISLLRSSFNTDDRNGGITIVEEATPSFNQDEFSDELMTMVYDSLKVIDVPQKGSDDFS